MSDPFDDARSAFVKLDDLLGRLVLVVPLEVRTEPSTLPGSQGKTFEKVIADTVVLDGPVTDLIEAVPSTLDELHWSGQVVVGQLKPKVRITNGMVLGRLAKQPSKTKGFGPAWVLESPTDADKVIARPAAKAYLDAHAEPDPFGEAAV